MWTSPEVLVDHFQNHVPSIVMTRLDADRGLHGSHLWSSNRSNCELGVSMSGRLSMKLIDEVGN